MSNWYTCTQCQERFNGDFKHGVHVETAHPEYAKEQRIKQILQAIKDDEEGLALLRDNLAYLEAGHTLVELEQRRQERIHEAVLAEYRAQAEAKASR